MRSLLLLALALCPVLVQAQTPAFGDRVGDVLDAEERAYFGLFPLVGGFAEARGMVGPYDTLRVEILTGDGVGAVRPFTLMPEEARALRLYTETFERYPSASAHPRWTILSRFVDENVHIPYTGADRSVRVTLADGVLGGQLLYADDDHLVLTPSLSSFETALDGAYALPTSSVELIALDDGTRRPWRTLIPVSTAAGAAVLMQGVFAVRETGPSLRTRMGQTALVAFLGYSVTSLFGQSREQDAPPDELGASLSAWAHFGSALPPEWPAARLSETSPLPTLEPRRRQRSTRLFTVGVHAFVLNPEDATYGIPGQILTDPITRNSNPITYTGVRPGANIAVRLEGAVRPVSWARVGVLVDLATYEGEATVPEQEVAVAEPGRARAYAEAILALDPGRRFEVAAGGGLAQHTRRVAFEVPERFQNAILAEPRAYAFEEAGGVSPFVQGSAEFFSSPTVSLFAQAAWHILPPITVPEAQFVYLNDSTIVAYELFTHDARFSYPEWTVGTRFHF